MVLTDLVEGGDLGGERHGGNENGDQPRLHHAHNWAPGRRALCHTLTGSQRASAQHSYASTDNTCVKVNSPPELYLQIRQPWNFPDAQTDSTVREFAVVLLIGLCLLVEVLLIALNDVSCLEAYIYAKRHYVLIFIVLNTN